MKKLGGSCNCKCCKNKRERIPEIPELSREAKAFIGRLQQYHFLAAAGFIMAKKDESDVRFTALAPVYLEDGYEDMATVKANALALKELEEKNIITIDYDIPLRGFDYEVYAASRVYKELKEAVAEGSQRPGFLCNTTEIEKGSVALTPYGAELLDYI
ncbi:MAG: hypothetical protein Q4C00_08650 [Bacillota bacterium]|nr:hypothetical protein [Bacillota bacterium]